MTPIFGIDITLDKKNEVVNGDEFITLRNSDEDVERLDSEAEEFDEIIATSRLPLWLRIVQGISGLYALVVLVSAFRAGFEVGFSTAFSNAPIMIISGVISGIAWGVLSYIGRKKQAAVLEAAGADDKVRSLTKSAESLYKKLCVPDGAPEVDVFIFKYKKDENGAVKAKTVGFQTAPYAFFCVRLFCDGERLHIADTSGRYSFLLSELKGIRTVRKRISACNWTKDCEPTKGEFKEYKMTVNNVGDVFMKQYYILEVERGDELFGVYFPCYELSAFEVASGLSAADYRYDGEEDGESEDGAPDAEEAPTDEG